MHVFEDACHKLHAIIQVIFLFESGNLSFAFLCLHENIWLDRCIHKHKLIQINTHYDKHLTYFAIGELDSENVRAKNNVKK